ncbi:MAG TPA: hypothetical protein VD969_28720 [Symbiobacteriaceae bacterium]|nr:hypothetical protein [Symbiobacteriaceae bacterium]
MDSWQVAWYDARNQEQRKEFRSYLEAWEFNEQSLKGRGVVTLLTDQVPLSDRTYRSEAAAARQSEGGRRYTRKK